MAFKLLVEVTEDGVLNVEHEGQIDPVILLGSLRTLEHNVLTTVDAMAAQAAIEALEKAAEQEGAGSQGE